MAEQALSRWLMSWIISMRTRTKFHGGKGTGGSEFPDLVKMRLAHCPGGSLLVPDQIYLQEPSLWFQPLTFLPNLIARLDKAIHAHLYVDIAGDQTLRVNIDDAGFEGRLHDGSYLYRAMILGPKELPSLASGSWAMIDSRPYLRLFHHTTQAAKSSILTTLEFWPSAWNLRGTRKLKNVQYAYFTSLPRVRSHEDLAAIAMSSHKKLHYIRDGATVPPVLPLDWQNTPLALDILELEVYWSVPESRDHTVSVDVDSTLIAPHHVWRHTDRQVWHEVVLPSVLRVGLEPGKNLAITNTMRVMHQTGLRRFDYMVIGDATTLQGLAAPLNEEGTPEKFKLHDPGICLLTFWCTQANQDHFSSLAPHEQELESH